MAKSLDNGGMFLWTQVMGHAQRLVTGSEDSGAEVGGSEDSVSDAGSEVGGSDDTLAAVGLEQISVLQSGSLCSKHISSNAFISLFALNKLAFFPFITMRLIRALHWGSISGL